mgnify:CR=1 FL=1
MAKLLGRFSGVLKGLVDGKVAVQVGPDLKTWERGAVDELRLDDSALEPAVQAMVEQRRRRPDGPLAPLPEGSAS